MGYQPDPANQPTPPLDNYDNASETSPPLEDTAGDLSRNAAPADPAADGPAIYPWDEVDAEGRVVRRARAAPREAEAGAASTYNTSPAPQDLR
jgi:hypothetical protein